MEEVRCESSRLTLCADSGRVTHAINRVGVRVGKSSADASDPDVEADAFSEIEDSMPDRIAVASVPVHHAIRIQARRSGRPDVLTHHIQELPELDHPCCGGPKEV